MCERVDGSGDRFSRRFFAEEDGSDPGRGREKGKGCSRGGAAEGSACQRATGAAGLGTPPRARTARRPPRRPRSAQPRATPSPSLSLSLSLIQCGLGGWGNGPMLEWSVLRGTS